LYVGKDKDFEVKEEDKIKFSKHTQKEEFKIKACTEEKLKDYYPDTLKSF